MKHAGLDAHMGRRQQPESPGAMIERMLDRLWRYRSAEEMRAIAMMTSQTSSRSPSPGPLALDDIARMVETMQPPLPLFNGATRLMLAGDVYDKLEPNLAPLGRPTVERIAYMPDGHGHGYRPRVPSDPPDAIEVPGLGVLVFVIQPQETERGEAE